MRQSAGVTCSLSSTAGPRKRSVRVRVPTQKLPRKAEANEPEEHRGLPLDEARVVQQQGRGAEDQHQHGGQRVHGRDAALRSQSMASSSSIATISTAVATYRPRRR